VGPLPRQQLFGESFELRGQSVVLAFDFGIGQQLGFDHFEEDGPADFLFFKCCILDAGW
jgi:hypothetical protein